MSLPELMYTRLDQFPRVRTRTPLSARAVGFLKSSRYARNRRWNSFADIRVLSRLKPFYVDSSDLLAPRGSFVVYKDVHVFKYGTETIFRARYIGTLRKPSAAKVIQTIGADKRVVRVIYPTRGYYDCEVPHKIDYVGTTKATAEIRWRLRGDLQVKNFEFGLFDDRYKPVDEYPVLGADNAELTLAYDFKVGNSIYPAPIPEGVSITDMRVELRSGFAILTGSIIKTPI